MNFSTDNILPNLKKGYNTIAPVLNLPELALVKDSLDMAELKTEKLKDKAYAKGEPIPAELTGFGRGSWWGTGDGRTYREGGKTRCPNNLAGRNKNDGGCFQERIDKGMKWDDYLGFIDPKDPRTLTNKLQRP